MVAALQEHLSCLVPQVGGLGVRGILWVAVARESWRVGCRAQLSSHSFLSSTAPLGNVTLGHLGSYRLSVPLTHCVASVRQDTLLLNLGHCSAECRGQKTRGLAGLFSSFLGRTLSRASIS